MIFDKPSVSIIVPTYKRHDLLFNRCLPSIFNQKQTVTEIIIVADGPDPELKDKVAQLSFDHNEIKFVELPTNWGCYGGHCKLVGTYMSSCDLIGYLDDDDEYLPNHILELSDLQQSTGADFVYSKMHGPTKEGILVTVGDGDPAFMKIGTPMILHKRELLHVNQWRPSNNYCEDWELVNGWLNAGKTFAFLNEITVLLRGARLPTAKTTGFSGYGR